MQKVCDILALCTHMAPVPWYCVASSVMSSKLRQSEWHHQVLHELAVIWCVKW